MNNYHPNGQMNEQLPDLTISVFTENHVGLLTRIALIFTRRKINIESITVSESEVKGVHRFTIVVNIPLQEARKVVEQIERQVEVLKAFVHEDHEIVQQEIALYKVSTHNIPPNTDLERIVRDHHARILTFNADYMIIEKTGYKSETQQLFEQLYPFGMLEFVRSGRVAITKPLQTLTHYLKEMHQQSRHEQLL
ncbi:MAG: acetolactate synthase small subunit [Chitinophagales bacterium]|nr:acetolactate synthase small subunit [Chitinophagales bacterium]HNI44083.1 acetolactate synthase small subunit [Chitinophagales bacterium]